MRTEVGHFFRYNRFVSSPIDFPFLPYRSNIRDIFGLGSKVNIYQMINIDTIYII
jgi:hypothetical protein